MNTSLGQIIMEQFRDSNMLHILEKTGRIARDKTAGVYLFKLMLTCRPDNDRLVEAGNREVIYRP